ncbi:YciI family protein [Terricaulis sp.]|uniref:YciI family protein n=1 Tax=Terricaulis sp. TaxID=2768686 RepID=UPI0037852F64
MQQLKTAIVSLCLALAACVSSPSAAQTPAPEAHVQAQQTQLFLFVYSPGPAWRAGVPMAQQDMRPHGGYMRQLLEEGTLVAGGGFTDRNGGMAIVRAADMETARALLAADPAISSGVFVAECMAWRPRFGGTTPLLAPAQ